MGLLCRSNEKCVKHTVGTQVVAAAAADDDNDTRHGNKKEGAVWQK